MKRLSILFLLTLAACAGQVSAPPTQSTPGAPERTVASLYSETEKKFRCYYDDSFYYRTHQYVRIVKDKVYLNRKDITPPNNTYKIDSISVPGDFGYDMIILEHIKSRDLLFCRHIAEK